MKPTMVVANGTIDAAFDSFVEHYAKRKERAWEIASHLKMYRLREKAFSGAGDFGSFRDIYEELRRYWQALRPCPTGTWSAEKTFDVLRSLGQECRSKALSTLTAEDWPAVWRCIHEMRDLKPCKSGPSVVAISKFLHFWNPRLFMIVDVAMVEDRVLGHRWLRDQLPEMPLGQCEALFPGADQERNASLVHYLRVLMWAGNLVKTNPHIREGFASTVKKLIGGDESLEDIEKLEAPAVEWFLLGLVELPPAGVDTQPQSSSPA